MESSKRDFNTAAHALLGLSAFAVIMAIVNSITNMQLQSMMGYSNSTLVAEIVCDVLILAAIVLTFMKKRVGLIALTVIFIIRMFATIPWGSDVSSAYMLGGKTVLFLRDFGLFAIAMCFKKNGISGWKSMLASDEYVEKNTIKSVGDKIDSTQPQVVEAAADSDVAIEKQGTVETIIEPQITERIVCQTKPLDAPIDEVSIKEVEPQKELSGPEETQVKTKHASRPRKKINWKKLLTIAIPVAVAAGLLSLVIVVLSDTYPDHFGSFGAKFKYHFGMHNNHLAKEYLEKHRSAEQAGLDEMSKEFAEVAYKANPSNRIVLDSLSQVFYVLGETWTDDVPFYKKAIDICNEGLKKYPDDKELMRTYIRSSFRLSDKDDGKNVSAKEYRTDAFKMSERLLLEDPNSMLGFYMMCIKTSDDKEWQSLLRWAEKALAQEGHNEEPDFLYFKAKALYETGKHDAAKDLYLQAESINPSNYLHAQYAIIGGFPCEILSVNMENRMGDGTIITKAGNTLYDDNTIYIVPVLTVKPLRTGSFSFDIKFFQGGNLSTGSSSPDGYSYSSQATLQGSTNQTISLGGWGYDTPGNWEDGGYRIEIWWAGERLFTKSFSVYSGFWHNLGYGNRFD